ncbi:type II toxin-antitoxin system RnlB family antitoxin [Thomasclavelia sp.]|uniref:type II toxin-antitoxin system RnlB family antitoxin n=1 Tax=Thomasclavelia sp. TaxID=3025757 RepID=UPI0025E020F7|nr:type II toxin-antitoxin system RnlB family antitoxin [Thomasclavelia sp.]
MEKLYVNHIKNDSNYVALVTVLDYEILLSKYLKQLTFDSSSNQSKRVLVDLALKSGIDKNRFIEFDVNESGKIKSENHKYVVPDTYYINLANKYLKEKEEIVSNSMLTESQKRMILQ